MSEELRAQGMGDLFAVLSPATLEKAARLLNLLDGANLEKIEALLEALRFSGSYPNELELSVKIKLK